MNLVGSRSYATPAKAIGSHKIFSQKASVSGGTFAFLKETLCTRSNTQITNLSQNISAQDFVSQNFGLIFSEYFKEEIGTKNDGEPSQFYVQKVYGLCFHKHGLETNLLKTLPARFPSRFKTVQREQMQIHEAVVLPEEKELDAKSFLLA